MTTDTLAYPADTERRIRSVLERALREGDYLVQVCVHVLPCDAEGRKCAAWLADHYEVCAYWYADCGKPLGPLHEAVKALDGVYRTTTEELAPGEGYHRRIRITDPEWPAPARRRDRPYHPYWHPSVLALLRDR